VTPGEREVFVVRPPKLQALVLADHIYVDAQSGKKIIVGVFDRLMAKSFPTKLDRPTWAYILLTEIQGKVGPFVIRYVDLKDERVLMTTHPMEVECPNPLATVTIMMQVPPFEMPHPGNFAFEVCLGDTPLGALRVSVEKIKPADRSLET